MPPTLTSTSSAPVPLPLLAADAPDVLARFRSELDLVDLNARQVARRIGYGPVTLDDLRSFGQEGLLMAARTFDSSRGVPFRRWANLRIRGTIIDGVRKWGSLPRRIYRELRAITAADALQEVYDEEDTARPATTAQAADTRLSSYLAGLATAMATGTMVVSVGSDGDPGHDLTPEQLVESAELVTRVKSIVSRLPPSERALVEGHYFGEQTLDETAASLGLSKSWGSRLHARAIDAIARELRREHK